MKRTKEQEQIFERITRPLAGKTLIWTPFFRVKSSPANRARRWGPTLGWTHWHADWHLIGVHIRLWGGEYDVSWVSDPSYFFLKKRNRLL